MRIEAVQLPDGTFVHLTDQEQIDLLASFAYTVFVAAFFPEAGTDPPPPPPEGARPEPAFAHILAQFIARNIETLRYREPTSEQPFRH